MANGKVVFQGQVNRDLGVVTTVRIRVTSAMIPQARLVAFYRLNNELVTDSTIMEVEEELPNQVWISLLFTQQFRKNKNNRHPTDN